VRNVVNQVLRSSKLERLTNAYGVQALFRFSVLREEANSVALDQIKMGDSQLDQAGCRGR
jgi:hypothetical protein